MNAGRYLACLQIIISVLAGIGYAYAGDARRSIYWLSASVLTACVTF